MIYKKSSQLIVKLFITLFVTLLMAQPVMATEIYLPLILTGSAPSDDANRNPDKIAEENRDQNRLIQSESTGVEQGNETPQENYGADDSVVQVAEVSEDDSRQTHNLRIATQANSNKASIQATSNKASIWEIFRLKRLKNGVIAIVAMLIFIGKVMMGASRKDRGGGNHSVPS